jgi:hypothetical protein
MKQLTEGIDYTVEDGKIVFTKTFLLNRGYCCNSKCRNCPYKIIKETKEEINNES